MFQISYDDLLGTRSRHYGQSQFSISGLRSAGVTEAMLREAYPGGIPDTSFTGIIHLSILLQANGKLLTVCKMIKFKKMNFPQTFTGTVDLTSDNEEDIKTEDDIKVEQDNDVI